MQHSVKQIAKRYAEFSDRRKDKKKFSESGFIQFANDNKKKYSIIENGDDDLLVSTWYSDELIKDYEKTL